MARSGESTGRRPSRRSGGRRRRRWRRRILITLVVLVLALGALVVFAPPIIGAVAPGPLARAINSEIPGEVELEGVSLSWRGPQRVRSARLRDAGGEQIADVSLEASTSLLELVRGSRDLGVVTLAGDARVVRDREGVTNVERALGLNRPRAADTVPPGRRDEPARLPEGLEGRLRLDDLRVVWVDRAANVEGRAVVAGEGTFSTADGVSFDLGADLSSQKRGGAQREGRLQLAGAITDLTDQERRLRLEQANVDITLEATEAPAALIDSLASMEGQVAQALGDWVTVTAAAQGRMQDLRATVDLESPTAQARLALRSEGERISLSEPGVIVARGPALLESWPQLREMISADGQIELLEAPEITIELASASARLPAGGAGFDLGAVALEATIRATPAAARLAALEEGAAPLNVRTRPVEIRLAAAPLSAGVRAEGTAGAMLDDRNAGELRFRLDAQPLDGEGRVQTRPGDLRARGEIALTGFETRIAQPYVEAYGVQLAEDLGPEAEVVVLLSPAEGGEGGEGQSTSLAARLRSSNLNADAALQFEGEVVALTRNGVSVRMAQAGPLATRLLADAGITFDSAEQVTVHIREGRANIEAARLGDLRSLGAQAAVRVGAARGSAVVGEEQRMFQTQPITVSVSAPRLAEGARIEVRGAASVDGQEAGEVELTASASDLLDRAGQLRMELPESLAASGHLRRLPTALAQPFVEQAGLNLPEDVGPLLDVQFEARPQRGASRAVALHLEASSAKVDLAADAIWNGRRLTSTGEGVRATVRDPGAALARLLPPDLPVMPQAGGAVYVQLPAFSAALANGFDPAGVTGRAVVRVEGVSARGREGEPVRIEQIALRYHAPTVDAARLELDGQLFHGDRPFSLAGAFNVVRPLAALAPGEPGEPALTWAERLVAMHPAGDLQIRGLPPSLAALIAPAAEGVELQGEEGGEPIDLAELLEEVTEGPLTIALGVITSGEDGGSAVRLDLTVDGGPTRIAAGADITPRLVRVRSATVDARLEPGLIAALAPESPARLTAPAPLRLVAAPVEIPLTETGALDLASVGEFAVEISTPGQMLVEGLTAGGADGEPPRELPAIGARGLNVRITAPGAALGSAGEVVVQGQTEVITAGDRVVAQAQFGATAQTSAGRLNGDPTVSATLRGVDAVFLDELAGQPLLVSGALGERIGEVILEADGRLGQAPEEPAFDVRRAMLAIEAPRLRSSGPLRLHREGGALTLDEPVELVWQAVPGWTNRFIARASQGEGPPPAHVARFSAPAEFAVRLERVAIGPPGQTLAPDRFALAASVAAQRVGLMTGAGEDVSFTDVAITLTGGETPGQVSWDLRALQRGVEEQGAIEATGALASLADAEGALTLRDAALTLDLEAPALRSAALDTIMQQGGLIHATMGRTMTISAHVESFSRAGGTLQASARSPRADLAIQGEVQEGALVVTGPPRLVTIREITPQLSDLIAPSLPQIARFEKQPQDEPGFVDQQNLRFPLDGDLSKLNGQLTIALGQARFQTSSAFARLLKTVQADSQAMVGRRLDPLVLTMENGVIRYDRYQIPLGEFSLEASGMIDLPQQRLDVVTWIPIGALTDEAAGMFNTGLGSLLGRAVPEFERLTMVPWRTRGRFGDTRTLPAPDLFVENVGGRLLRPDRILRDVFRDYRPGGQRPQQEEPPQEEPRQEEPAPAGGGGGGGGGG